MACINVNSLMKHIDEIRFILTSTTLEVLAINESKLDNSINDGEYISPDMFLYVKIARDMEAECSFILRKIWLIQIGVI